MRASERLRRVAILAAACASLAGLGGFGASAALAAAPPNDSFAKAKVLSGKQVEVGGSTAQATIGPCSQDRDVWYRWTAPESGPVMISIEPASGTAPFFDVGTGTSECDLSEPPLADYWGGPDNPACDYECDAFEAAAGRRYNISVSAPYEPGYSEPGPFTLRLVEDNLAPETTLKKVKWGPHNRFRQRRKPAVIKVRAAVTDLEPSAEPVFLQCRFGHKGQFETCDREWGTDSTKLLPWRAGGSPVGNFTTRPTVEVRGVDGLLNADPTPLELRLKVKARCIGGGGVGGKECWLRRVKVRR